MSKEFQCLCKVSDIVEKPDIAWEQICQEVVHLLPGAWLHKDVTCAQLNIADNRFKTGNYRETKWKQSADIMLQGVKIGSLEVCYLEEMEKHDEGPFLATERALINNIAHRIGGVIERLQTKNQLKESEHTWRRFMEEAPVAFILFDRNLNYIDVNEAAIRLSGEYSKKDEIMGKNILEINPGLEATDRYDKYLGVIRTGEPIEFEDVAPVSKFGDLNLTVRAFKVGEGLGIITSDITRRKRAEQELEKAKNELETEVNERTEELRNLNKRLRSMARQLSLVQARERRHIATLLHDSVNQNLATCVMKLQALMKQASSTELYQPLNEICDKSQIIMKELRSLTFQLSPPLLYEMGLEAALEELTKTFQRDYNLKCVFHTDGEPKPLDKDMSILLYQTARELLWNAVRHAKAKRIVVETLRLEDEIQIIVSDDGVGLDLGILYGKKGSKGFGLFSIRELMRDLDGRLEAEYSTRGTRIFLTVPARQQQATED